MDNKKEVEIRVYDKIYKGVYFTDMMFGETFHNFNVYVNGQLQSHATLSKEISEEELFEKTRSYAQWHLPYLK